MHDARNCRKQWFACRSTCSASSGGVRERTPFPAIPFARTDLQSRNGAVFNNALKPPSILARFCIRRLADNKYSRASESPSEANPPFSAARFCRNPAACGEATRGETARAPASSGQGTADAPAPTRGGFPLLPIPLPSSFPTPPLNHTTAVGAQASKAVASENGIPRVFLFVSAASSRTDAAFSLRAADFSHQLIRLASQKRGCLNCFRRSDCLPALARLEGVRCAFIPRRYGARRLHIRGNHAVRLRLAVKCRKPPCRSDKPISAGRGWQPALPPTVFPSS